MGTNQADVDVWKVYSAVGDKSSATPNQALSSDAPTTSLCSEGWHCDSTDTDGNVYTGRLSTCYFMSHRLLCLHQGAWLPACTLT